MIFTRQLATTDRFRLPCCEGLNVLMKQERDKVLKNTINKLADAVQAAIHSPTRWPQHPRIFNDLYVNHGEAGEVGGVLELC